MNCNTHGELIEPRPLTRNSATGDNRHKPRRHDAKGNEATTKTQIVHEIAYLKHLKGQNSQMHKQKLRGWRNDNGESLCKLNGILDSTFKEQSPVRILRACENISRKQDKSLVTSVSSKHSIVLGMYFHTPRCRVGTGLLQLLLFICLYGKMFLPCLACPCDCKLYSSQPSEYKLSDALNKIGYYMKLQSDSFLGPALSGSHQQTE